MLVIQLQIQDYLAVTLVGDSLVHRLYQFFRSGDFFQKNKHATILTDTLISLVLCSCCSSSVHGACMYQFMYYTTSKALFNSGECETIGDEKGELVENTAPMLKILWHSTAQLSTAQHSTAQHSIVQRSTAHHSRVQTSTMQQGIAQCNATQHSAAQHSTARHIKLYVQLYVGRYNIDIHCSSAKNWTPP